VKTRGGPWLLCSSTINFVFLPQVSHSKVHIPFVSATEPGSDEHYLQQAWGAYGAAYGSQLYEIGIFDSSMGLIYLVAKSQCSPHLVAPGKRLTVG
jgi:hypothetical protein